MNNKQQKAELLPSASIAQSNMLAEVYSVGQRLKVKLEDGTIWDGCVSDENTFIVDPTEEYQSYYFFFHSTGSEYPESMDNEYTFEEIEVLSVI